MVQGDLPGGKVFVNSSALRLSPAHREGETGHALQDLERRSSTDSWAKEVFKSSASTQTEW